MATIKEVKTQIQNANALGRQNLTEKGVTIPENATSYEIMKSIADVSGGGSPSIDENGIVTFGGSTTIDEDGIVSL